jgi:peroxiredoxin (alkyl hydroperoxide reductase subunit C)
LCAFSDRIDDFHGLDARVYGISVDSAYTHLAFLQKPRSDGGVRGLRFPLLSDLKRQTTRAHDVLTNEGFAARATILIDPDGIVQHVSINHLAIGRSVDEIVRTLKACQSVRAGTHTVARAGDCPAEGERVCPADWKPGDETIKPDTFSARRYFMTRRKPGEPVLSV